MTYHYEIVPPVLADENAIIVDPTTSTLTIYTENALASIDAETQSSPATYSISIWLRTSAGTDVRSPGSEMLYSITISDPLCASVTPDLSLGVIPSPSLTYHIGDQPGILIFFDYASTHFGTDSLISLEDCDELIYSIVDIESAGGAIDSEVFTYNAESGTFYIATNDQDKAGVYTMELVA